MEKIKGCINYSCEAYKKKINYEESDAFCKKCGSPLVYVCKDCHMQLPDDSGEYCIRCLAKREDKKDKRFKFLGNILALISSIATVVITALLQGDKKR